MGGRRRLDYPDIGCFWFKMVSKRFRQIRTFNMLRIDNEIFFEY